MKWRCWLGWHYWMEALRNREWTRECFYCDKRQHLWISRTGYETDWMDE